MRQSIEERERQGTTGGTQTGAMRTDPCCEPEISIGAFAERSGVAASALRYYEELGLLLARRTSAGHRRYPRAMIRRVAYIQFAQKLGFTLQEIGNQLDRLPTDRVPRGKDWARLSAEWTERLEARIAELERLRDGLTECIGCGCLSLARCQMLNPGDRVGEAGPGPRVWIGDASGSVAASRSGDQSRSTA